MQDIEQLQLSYVYLAAAANILDGIGANAAAAKAESAIEILRSDIDLQESWVKVCDSDWEHLDKMIDTLTNDGSILRIATIDG